MQDACNKSSDSSINASTSLDSKSQSQHAQSPDLNDSKDGKDKAKAICSNSKVTERAKKKAWYHGLYPSYKSRCEDFKKLFKDVPDDERLIVGEYRF